MNRTEHRLRMSFEPEYGEKWDVLLEVRKERMGCFRSGFIPFLFWTILISTIFRTWGTLLTNPVLYLLFCIVYYLYHDRLTRKHLGI